MTTETAILIGATLATVGWWYTGRRARTVGRKQHTINVMLQASFNKEFRDAFVVVAPHLKSGNCPDLTADDNSETRAAFRLLLNHYEFIAAGLRNGDFDERLIRDSERGSILSLQEACQDYVYRLRDSRRRQSIYEHLEWLHARWETKPPRFLQRICEWGMARPFQGKRVDPHA